MSRQVVRDWIDRTQNARNRQSANIKPLRQAALAGMLPGYWGSDHLAELQHFTEWQYIAIHAVAIQFALSTVSVKTTRPTAKTKGSAPWIAKSYMPDEAADGLVADPQHPIKKRLERPNPLTGWSRFAYQIAQQIRLTGAGIIWKVPSVLELQTGKKRLPAALWVMPRGWLRPIIPSTQYPLGAFRVQPITHQWTEWFASPVPGTFTLDVRDTIRVGWPHPLWPNEYTSPLDACRRIVDVGEQTETATLAGMRNTVRPSMVINFPDGVSQEAIDQTAQMVEAYKAGAENAGKILSLIGSDLKADINRAVAELDYVNGREQNAKFQRMIQNVPGMAVGDHGDVSYGGFAAGMKAWIELSVAPTMGLLADELTHEWEDIYPGCRIEINAKNYDDVQIQHQRADKVFAGLDKGASSVNEWRKEMDFPPIPGGDEYKKQQDPAMAGAGAGARAMPGAPAQPGAPEQPQAETEDFDFDIGIGDDTTTGQRMPEQQAASGNRMPQFMRNGVAKAFSTNGKH